MKKNLSAILLFIFVIIFSQARFRPGYFIKNDNSKVNCLIKNNDWGSNPEKILYKEVENAPKKEIEKNAFKEFFVNNTRYKKFSFKIDKSSNSNNSLDYNSEPNWVTTTSFLKILVDQEIQLLKFSENGEQKFFIYDTKKDIIEQLLYKQYLIEKNGTTYTAKNNFYKKQLATINPDKSTDNVEYNEQSLINWFSETYGIPSNERVIKESGKTKITFKAGFLSTYEKITTSLLGFESKLDMDAKSNFSASVDLEYILPFNHSKWSLFIEPTYNSYKSMKKFTLVNPYRIPATKSNYTYELEDISILLPVGIKHYMIINQKNKLFLSGALAVSLPLKNKITIWDSTNNTNDLIFEDHLSFPIGFQVGGGYVFNNKVSVEAKYIMQKSTINTNTKLSTNIFGISVGYNFLK